MFDQIFNSLFDPKCLLFYVVFVQGMLVAGCHLFFDSLYKRLGAFWLINMPTFYLFLILRAQH